MPGLTGFVPAPALRENASQTLQQMQRATLHRDFYQRDELFEDGVLWATRSRNNILQTAPQPHAGEDCYVWLDGEFYNQDDLKAGLKTPAQTDPELLLALYQQHRNFKLLREIDGIFAAVLYDRRDRQVHLIGDRRGLRYLYWTVFQNSFVWTSELKSLLHLPGFQPQIDRQAVENFLGIRYLIGNQSWFAGVELLPPASVLTWDIDKHSLSPQRYWWWDEISPLAEPLDRPELAAEVGRRFMAAVERRCRAGERVGLSLSGGLDSRAIIAAMPDRGDPIHAVTFGQKGCDDVRIAAQVADVKGAILHEIDMNADNWIDSLAHKVWETDAACSTIHMQFVPALSAIAQNNWFDINLNGVPGDANIGGSHFFTSDRLEYFVEKRLGLQTFATSPEHRQAVLQRFQEYYQAIGESSYILVIDNRVRSFAIKDARLSIIDGVETRFPFLDNALEDLLFAIPEAVKANNHFYEQVLLQTFPEFYKTIPRQGTGVPIGPPSLGRKVRMLSQRVQKKAVRGLSKFGVRWPERDSRPQQRELSDFTNHATWIRQEPARSFFERVLLNREALYQDYLPIEQVERDWLAHLKGHNHSDKLSLVLTLELWLQQVFTGEYRPRQ